MTRLIFLIQMAGTEDVHRQILMPRTRVTLEAGWRVLHEMIRFVNFFICMENRHQLLLAKMNEESCRDAKPDSANDNVHLLYGKYVLTVQDIFSLLPLLQS